MGYSSFKSDTYAFANLRLNLRMTNSIDPDEMALWLREPYHLDLHCLQRYTHAGVYSGPTLCAIMQRFSETSKCILKKAYSNLGKVWYGLIWLSTI